MNNRTIRILQVITSLNLGGAETVATDLSVALQARGFAVDVAVFNDSDTRLKERLLACGCQVFPFGHSFYDLRYVGKLRCLMRNYDIVHTHNTSPQYFAAIASLGTSTVLVTTEHSTSNRRRSWLGGVWMDRLVYGRYRKIICISNKAEENFRAYIGHCKAKVLTIPNGIDVEAFYQASAPERLRDHKRFVVAMVAGFRHEKDQDTLLRAMAQLPEAQFELWLIGDGVRRETLELQACQLGMQESVKFWGVRNDVAALLHAADAVVMSSHYEGLSLSNVEGMSVGKPFVASDVDGLREVTEGAGLLFPHGDADALARILLKLQQEPAYAMAIARSCYRRAQQYDIAKTIDAYSEIYESLNRKI